MSLNNIDGYITTSKKLQLWETGNLGYITWCRIIKGAGCIGGEICLMVDWHLPLFCCVLRVVQNYNKI